jgi:hypothetical protein
MNKPLKLPNNTIFVGCSHLDHKQPFLWQKRGFPSPEAHADYICDEIAVYYCANPTAVMVHLGDGFLNSTPERARAYFARWTIPTYYLWGNHEGPSFQLYKAALLARGMQPGEEVYPTKIDNVTFLGTEATLSIDKQHIVACHFPLAIWNQSHHAVWHVHSHCHGSYPESLPNHLDLKRLECGVEVCMQTVGKPYITFAQIKTIMDRKKVHKVDHHDSQTG